MHEYSPIYHNNPSQRTPCLLVLDASGSMDTITPTGKKRIDELNAGLIQLQQELMRDETAAMRVQLAIVCIGGESNGAKLIMDWTDAIDFKPPHLTAGGLTPLGEGMRMALQHVDTQKRQLQANGIGYTRPWIMVITDGEPTDSATWQIAVQECRSAETNKRCTIYPIGVADADMTVLQHISSTPALKLSEAKFKEYFQWLSRSLSSVSRSRPGEQVQMPAPNPWVTTTT